jgi:hypothetical protein
VKLTFDTSFRKLLTLSTGLETYLYVICPALSSELAPSVRYVGPRKARFLAGIQSGEHWTSSTTR